MSATLIQSLLKDDKSKVATLIAAGASACALIYYNQEIRNQIANIFMVRLFYLLFLLPFSFYSLSLSLVYCAWRDPSFLGLDLIREQYSPSLNSMRREVERERERDERWEKRKKNARLVFAAVITILQSKQKFLLRASFFLFPARRLVCSSVSLSFSLSFCFETTLNALTNVFS